MSDIRQEFEQGVAIPDDCEWLESRNRYCWKGYTTAHPFNSDWEEFERGYECAHKAQQAEIERITKIKDLALACVDAQPEDQGVTWFKLQAALEDDK